MSQHGKKYRQAFGQIDREKLYTPVEAVRTLKSLETAKFDEAVEVLPPRPERSPRRAATARHTHAPAWHGPRGAYRRVRRG